MQDLVFYDGTSVDFRIGPTLYETILEKCHIDFLKVCRKTTAINRAPTYCFHSRCLLTGFTYKFESYCCNQGLKL